MVGGQASIAQCSRDAQGGRLLERGAGDEDVIEEAQRHLDGGCVRHRAVVRACKPPGSHNLALQHLADKGPEHNLGWRSRLRRRVGGRLCLCCRPATQAHHAEGDSVQRRALQRVDGAALHVKYLVQGDAQAQVGDNLGPPVWWASQ